MSSPPPWHAPASLPPLSASNRSQAPDPGRRSSVISKRSFGRGNGHSSDDEDGQSAKRSNTNPASTSPTLHRSGARGVSVSKSPAALRAARRRSSPVKRSAATPPVALGGPSPSLANAAFPQLTFSWPSASPTTANLQSSQPMAFSTSSTMSSPPSATFSNATIGSPFFTTQPLFPAPKTPLHSSGGPLARKAAATPDSFISVHSPASSLQSLSGGQHQDPDATFHQDDDDEEEEEEDNEEHEEDNSVSYASLKLNLGPNPPAPPMIHFKPVLPTSTAPNSPTQSAAATDPASVHLTKPIPVDPDLAERYRQQLLHDSAAIEEAQAQLRAAAAAAATGHAKPITPGRPRTHATPHSLTPMRKLHLTPGTPGSDTGAAFDTSTFALDSDADSTLPLSSFIIDDPVAGGGPGSSDPMLDPIALRNHLDLANTSIRGLTALARELQSKLAGSDARADSLSSQLVALEREVELERRRTTKAIDAEARAQRSLEHLEAVIRETEGGREKVAEGASRLAQENSRLRRENKALVEDMDGLRFKVELLEKTVTDGKRERDVEAAAAKRAISHAQRERDVAMHKCDELKGEVETLARKLARALTQKRAQSKASRHRSASRGPVGGTVSFGRGARKGSAGTGTGTGTGTGDGGEDTMSQSGSSSAGEGSVSLTAAEQMNLKAEQLQVELRQAKEAATQLEGANCELQVLVRELTEQKDELVELLDQSRVYIEQLEREREELEEMVHAHSGAVGEEREASFGDELAEAEAAAAALDHTDLMMGFGSSSLASELQVESPIPVPAGPGIALSLSESQAPHESTFVPSDAPAAPPKLKSRLLSGTEVLAPLVLDTPKLGQADLVSMHSPSLFNVPLDPFASDSSPQHTPPRRSMTPVSVMRPPSIRPSRRSTPPTVIITTAATAQALPLPPATDATLPFYKSAPRPIHLLPNAPTRSISMPSLREKINATTLVPSMNQSNLTVQSVSIASAANPPSALDRTSSCRSRKSSFTTSMRRSPSATSTFRAPSTISAATAVAIPTTPAVSPADIADKLHAISTRGKQLETRARDASLRSGAAMSNLLVAAHSKDDLPGAASDVPFNSCVVGAQVLGEAELGLFAPNAASSSVTKPDGPKERVLAEKVPLAIPALSPRKDLQAVDSGAVLDGDVKQGQDQSAKGRTIVDLAPLSVAAGGVSTSSRLSSSKKRNVDGGTVRFSLTNQESPFSGGSSSEADGPRSSKRIHAPDSILDLSRSASARGGKKAAANRLSLVGSSTNSRTASSKSRPVSTAAGEPHAKADASASSGSFSFPSFSFPATFSNQPTSPTAVSAASILPNHPGAAHIPRLFLGTWMLKWDRRNKIAHPRFFWINHTDLREGVTVLWAKHNPFIPGDRPPLRGNSDDLWWGAAGAGSSPGTPVKGAGSGKASTKVRQMVKSVNVTNAVQSHRGRGKSVLDKGRTKRAGTDELTTFLVIHTRTRYMDLQAPTLEDHKAWFEGLKYLVEVQMLTNKAVASASASAAAASSASSVPVAKTPVLPPATPSKSTLPSAAAPPSSSAFGSNSSSSVFTAANIKTSNSSSPSSGSATPTPSVSGRTGSSSGTTRSRSRVRAAIPTPRSSSRPLPNAARPSTPTASSPRPPVPDLPPTSANKLAAAGKGKSKKGAADDRTSRTFQWITRKIKKTETLAATEAAATTADQSNSGLLQSSAPSATSLPQSTSLETLHHDRNQYPLVHGGPIPSTPAPAGAASPAIADDRMSKASSSDAISSNASAGSKGKGIMRKTSNMFSRIGSSIGANSSGSASPKAEAEAAGADAAGVGSVSASSTAGPKRRSSVFKLGVGKKA